MYCGRPESALKNANGLTRRFARKRGKRTMKTKLSMIGGFCLTMLLVGCGSSSGGALASFGSGGSGPGAGGAGGTSGQAGADGGDSAAPNSASNACSGATVDAAATATILDPTGIYGGKTYGQWGDAYFKWLFELPGPDFPFADSTGAVCATAQSRAEDGGAVADGPFFLACTNAGRVTRTCTIPAGRMLFLPMADWYGDNGGMAVGSQFTDQQWQDELSATAASVTTVALEIDGKCYGSTKSDFAPYLTEWSQYSYTVPNTPSNYYATFNSSTFTGPVPSAFAGGYFILLAPLSAGSHTIHFTSLRPAISEDVTYNLTVQ
jgi:hypothetical protein